MIKARGDCPGEVAARQLLMILLPPVHSMKTKRVNHRKRRRVTNRLEELWGNFEAKKHPWIVVKSNGLYCLYCSHSQASAKSKNGKFVSVPFNGVRPNKLMKHKTLVTHQSCADDHREFETRQASSSSIVEIIQKSSILTVDKGAFCDVLAS